MTWQGSLWGDRKNHHLWSNGESWLGLIRTQGNHFLWWSHISNNTWGPDDSIEEFQSSTQEVKSLPCWGCLSNAWLFHPSTLLEGSTSSSCHSPSSWLLAHCCIFDSLPALGNHSWELCAFLCLPWNANQMSFQFYNLEARSDNWFPGTST